MTNLLRHPEFAASSHAIAARMRDAAKRVVSDPAGGFPAQVSRRELLQIGSEIMPDMALIEPEPDRDLQRLGRYIAWRTARDTTSSASPSPRTLVDPQSPSPGLPGDEVLDRNLEHVAWTPELWPALDEQALGMLVFQRLVSFAKRGISVDPSLAGMYPTVAERLSEAQRLQVLADVAFALEPDGEQVGVLLPFLYNDPSPSVTAYAAFLWAQRMPATGDDGVDGVHAVVRLASALARVDLARPQFMLGGLLALGDGRSLAVLDGCWRWFPDNQQAGLGASLFVPVTAAQLEWTLRWMEDSSDNDMGFGAKALVNAADRGGDMPLIYDLHWHLPVPRVDDSDDPEWQYPWTVLQAWTFPRYAAILEPRLRRLLLREETEPIVTYVLAAWGLEPGEWDEVDQWRRIGERYLAHIAALRQIAAPPATDQARQLARARIASAVGDSSPLMGLAQLLDSVAKTSPLPRWVAADPCPRTGNDEASLTRAESDAMRRLLRAQFGPNLSAVVSDLTLLSRRWDELGLPDPT